MICRIITSCLTAFFVTHVFSQELEVSSESTVLKAAIVDYSASRSIVTLSKGRDDGITLGDRFWIFDEQGAAGSGTIFFVAGKGSAGHLYALDRPPSAHMPVMIVRQVAVSILRNRAPAGVTIRGQVSKLPPGNRTAWLDIGGDTGLIKGDNVLIRRNDIPIARGQVALIEEEVALITLQLLVGNALPAVGDQAELWPTPDNQRYRRINSTVLSVQPDKEGALITIVGTADDGLAEDRIVDLFRQGKYIGVASITETSDPLSVAQLIASASADTPAVGDEVLVRPQSGPSPAPLTAAIFRIEGDYCLFAAGEPDNVYPGEKFVVRRQDSADADIWLDIAALEVATVKQDFSGANIRALKGSGTPARVKLWDMAERCTPSVPIVKPIGIVEQINAGSRCAVVSINPQTAIMCGNIVRWRPAPDTSTNIYKPPGAAIVVHLTEDSAIIHVPVGWGNINHLLHAQVEISTQR